MQLYSWRACNKNGQRFKGELLAENQEAVATYIQQQYAYVMSIKPKHLWHTAFPGAPKHYLRAKEKTKLFQQLNSLLQSGMPLLRALALMQKKSSGRLSVIISSLQTDLQRGLSLTAAIKKYPCDFDELVGNIVAAGEASGQLPYAFKQLADFYEQETKLAGFLRNACIYPCTVLALTGGTLLYFTLQVVPLLTEIYASMQAEQSVVLVFLTKVIQLCITWRGVLVGLLVSLVVLLLYLLPRIQKLALKLPWVRELYAELLEVRYCRLLAILLHSGIVLPLALQTAANTLNNHQLKQQGVYVSKAVLRGMSLSRAASLYSGIFSPTTLEYVSVGESSGQLADMLLDAANIADRDLQAKLKDSKTIIEPFLLLLTAGIVGFLIFMLTAPIFGIITQMPEYS